MNTETFKQKTRDEQEILRCRVGSHSYGTAIKTSDEDFKGVFVAPKDQLLGALREKDVKRYSEDDQSYSLRHFARLAVKSVPNVLELLFCEREDIVHITAEGKRLRDNCELFLTQNCINPYIGYAEGQMKQCSKVPQGRGVGRTNLVEEFGYDTKFAMHCIRLLETGKELISTGILKVRRPNADFLLAIRSGEAFPTYEEFHDFGTKLCQELRECAKSTVLPEKPDMDTINQLIIELHESHWINYPRAKDPWVVD